MPPVPPVVRPVPSSAHEMEVVVVTPFADTVIVISTGIPDAGVVTKVKVKKKSTCCDGNCGGTNQFFS